MLQAVRAWPVWALPPALRAYVCLVPALALAVAVLIGRSTPVRTADLVVLAALLAGGAASVEVNRRLGEPAGTVTSDLLSVWWLPAAVLLPPVYSMLLPAPLMALTQWRVRRTVTHRRVLSAASIGLSHAGASALFWSLPESVTGEGAAAARPVLWALAAAACGALAVAGNAVLVGAAARAMDAQLGWRDVLWNRELAPVDAVELCTGVLVALVVGLDPLLVVVTLPPVLLLHRGLLHGQLRAAARIDAKTDALNAATWEREATSELARLHRLGQPAAVLLVDIDHFKRVNDLHGHLTGDRVLRAVADGLRSQLREGDVLGRFGGEEFAVLLPGADEQEARRVAERLRRGVAEVGVSVDLPVGSTGSAPAAAAVSVTVSIGVAMAEDTLLSVVELLSAADAGLYQAKAGGRDRVVLPPCSLPRPPTPPGTPRGVQLAGPGRGRKDVVSAAEGRVEQA